MNPTLATRCQQRQHQVYWRRHPPGPFVVDGSLPTALAGPGLPAPAADPAPAVMAACLGARPAGPRQELPNPDWMGTLLWLALVGLDAVLALVEVLQQLPTAPAHRDRGTFRPWGYARFEPLACRLRVLRQPLGSRAPAPAPIP